MEFRGFSLGDSESFHVSIYFAFSYLSSLNCTGLFLFRVSLTNPKWKELLY